MLRAFAAHIFGDLWKQNLRREGKERREWGRGGSEREETGGKVRKKAQTQDVPLLLSVFEVMFSLALAVATYRRKSTNKA